MKKYLVIIAATILLFSFIQYTDDVKYDFDHDKWEYYVTYCTPYSYIKQINATHGKLIVYTPPCNL